MKGSKVTLTVVEAIALETLLKDEQTKDMRETIAKNLTEASAITIEEARVYVGQIFLPALIQQARGIAKKVMDERGDKP